MEESRIKICIVGLYAMASYSICKLQSVFSRGAVTPHCFSLSMSGYPSISSSGWGLVIIKLFIQTGTGHRELIHTHRLVGSMRCSW